MSKKRVPEKIFLSMHSLLVFIALYKDLIAYQCCVRHHILRAGQSNGITQGPILPAPYGDFITRKAPPKKRFPSPAPAGLMYLFRYPHLHPFTLVSHMFCHSFSFTIASNTGSRKVWISVIMNNPPLSISVSSHPDFDSFLKNSSCTKSCKHC